MSKPHKDSTTTRFVSRPGEGVGIEVVTQILPQSDGTTLKIAGINLSSAPVPDRRYLADLAAVVYRHGLLKMVFAQETISSTLPTLRSMLVVSMPPNSARNFVLSLQQVGSPSFDSIAESFGIVPEPLLNIEQEPEQTIAFAANMLAIAALGRDACIDFYQASPFAMANINSASKIPIDPVVRVDLRTSLLLSLRNAVQELESSFPPEVTELKKIIKE